MDHTDGHYITLYYIVVSIWVWSIWNCQAQVKIQVRWKSGVGQVRVRKVRVRSESGLCMILLRACMQFYNVPYFSALAAHKNFAVACFQKIPLWALTLKGDWERIDTFPTHFETCMWYLLRITYDVCFFPWHLTSCIVWGWKFIQCNYPVYLIK